MAPLDITSNVITAGTAKTAREDFGLLEFAVVVKRHFDEEFVPRALAFANLSYTGC